MDQNGPCLIFELKITIYIAGNIRYIFHSKWMDQNGPRIIFAAWNSTTIILLTAVQSAECISM